MTLVILDIVRVLTGVTFFLATWQKLAVVRAHRGSWCRRRKRLLAVVMYACTASLLYASGGCFAAYVPGLKLVGGVAFGLIWPLVATVPCGVPYFNRPQVRPFRNAFFVAFGLVLTWGAVQASQMQI